MRRCAAPSILVVEDSNDDFEATRRALQAAARARGFGPAITRFDSGTSARQFFGNDATPVAHSIVLLDLNLPDADGRDILRVIRASQAWRALPVIVFSSSEEPRDVAASYEMGASAFVQKAVDPTRYKDAIKAIVDFWCSTAVLPNLKGY